MNKKVILSELKEKADELYDWLYKHSSPDVSADEFCKVANDLAILSVKIHIIQKW